MAHDIRKFNFNRDFDKGRSFSYQPSAVSEFRIKSLPNGMVKFESDISLLLNQQRMLDTLGLDTFKEWLSYFKASTEQTGVDTSKYTDEQLMHFIKSRYIQAPSELKAWSDYLNSCADEVISEYNAEMEKLRQAQEEEVKKAQQQVQTTSASE